MTPDGTPRLETPRTGPSNLVKGPPPGVDETPVWDDDDDWPEPVDLETIDLEPEAGRVYAPQPSLRLPRFAGAALVALTHRIAPSGWIPPVARVQHVRRGLADWQSSDGTTYVVPTDRFTVLQTETVELDVLALPDSAFAPPDTTTTVSQ